MSVVVDIDVDSIKSASIIHFQVTWRQLRSIYVTNPKCENDSGEDKLLSKVVKDHV